MDNINTTNVTTNATTGNLFRECGDGGDATIPGATFMNGVMMEIITAIRNSCQTPLTFDAQILTAILNYGMQSAHWRYVGVDAVVCWDCSQIVLMACHEL